MSAEGVGYADVLGDAQRLGYAEADPAADVEGWDARSKICILGKMGMGLTLDEEAMWCQGITRVSQDDFEYANMLNCTIKILAVTNRVDDDGTGTVNAFVSPHMVPMDSNLATTNGPTNLIFMNSKNIGTSVYIGPGAGREPTAQSVVADILRVQAPWQPAFGTRAVDANRFERDFSASWYIRITIKDEVGALGRVFGMLADEGISVFSALQTPIVDRERVTCAIITDECRLSQVEAVTKRMRNADGDNTALTFLVDDPFFMPFFGAD
jgi:hypothetical protein